MNLVGQEGGDSMCAAVRGRQDDYGMGNGSVCGIYGQKRIHAVGEKDQQTAWKPSPRCTTIGF